MPGFASVQWKVDGVPGEPQTSFFEQTRFEQLTFQADVVIAGEVHAIELVASFDPPLDLAKSVIES